MLRTRVWVVVGVLAIAACKQSGDGPAPTPSPACRAAGETLASFAVSDYAPPEERAQAAAPIQTECARAGLSDADAQCLADAKSRHEALRCPRVLTAELRAIDRAIPRGRCRPALLALHIAAEQALLEAPPERLEEAKEMLAMVKQTLARSCERDAWPDEVFACFDEVEVERGAECLQRLPIDVQQRLQAEIETAGRAMFEKHERRRRGLPAAELEPGALPPGVASTGSATCDAYLAARAAFDRCGTVPASTRSVLLGTVAALEAPWRKLPPGSVGAAPAFEPLCTAAHAQLDQLSAQLGCGP
jgi:hypothetical protein